LPETAAGLEALANLGQEGMAYYLQNWQQAQAARLKHLQFQLTPPQLDVIEEALAPFLSQTKGEQTDNPNRRGTALYLLCRAYLDVGGV
jgi:ParB family chromosome partitioning protein